MLFLFSLVLGAGEARAAAQVLTIDVNGVEDGSEVSGTLYIWSEISDTPKRVVYDLSGPVSYQYKAFKAPYYFRGINEDGTPRGIDTDKYPEGDYTLKVTASQRKTAPVSVQIRFTIRHGASDEADPAVNTWTEAVDAGTTTPDDPTAPARAIAFAAGVPLEYQQGSGVPIYFNLNGSLPKDAYVVTKVWHKDLGMMIDQYRHRVKQEPWRIEASMLDLIPPGNVHVHIVLRVLDQPEVKDDRWISFVASTSTGTNSGSIDTTNDPPTVEEDTTTDNSSDTTSSDSGTSTDATGSDTGSNTGSSTSPSTGTVANQHTFLGMNLAAVNYWAGAWTFVDVMNQATYRGLDGAWKRYTVYVGLDGHYPQGDYTPEYDGDGEVALSYRNGVTIKVRGDVRNLKVWTPGFAPGQSGEGQTFHPLFLERLRPFKTIRFMNWQSTNHADDQIKWSDRATPQDETQGNGKVALEYIIQLANELGVNPWVCMPHLANDDYVRNFAVMCRDRLDPNVKIYVEYSNEVWNGHFGQSQWMKNQAALNGRTKIEQWAFEAGKDFDIWMEIFAGQTHRLVRVAAAQENNPWVGKMLMKFLDGNFDALASTAYFGNRASKTLGSDATVLGLIEEALRDLAATRGPNRTLHGQLAREWSTTLGRRIPYISYEAGQHLVKSSLVSSSLVNSAQELPEMYDAYLKNLQSFEGAGGSLYMTFLNVRKNQSSGAWGHLQYQDQSLDGALKYRAVMDYLDSPERLALSMFD